MGFQNGRFQEVLRKIVLSWLDEGHPLFAVHEWLQLGYPINRFKRKAMQRGRRGESDPRGLVRNQNWNALCQGFGDDLTVVFSQRRGKEYRSTHSTQQ